MLILTHKLSAINWLIGKETESGLCIVHRYSGKTRVIPRGLME